MAEPRAVTIAAGQSLSPPLVLSSLGPGTVVGIAMPPAWTAADLTFQASVDGITWNDLYAADGVELRVVVAPGRHVALDPGDLAGVSLLRVRSGPTAAPVAQTAPRTITLVTRRL